ncbi:MAG: DUF3137 domain-containing protein [Bacteroidales bacterium]|nr:DUF3137 domain-containing protein [Bacteroidales bacterium]
MTKTIDFNALEERRKQIIKQNKNGLVKGVFFGGSVFFLGLILSFIVGFIGIIVSVMGVFVFIIVWILQDLKINKKIRTELFSEFIKFTNKNFKYVVEDKELLFEFKKAAFAPSNSNIFVEDVFKISIFEKEVDFGKITAKHLHQDGYLHDFIGVFGYMKINTNYSFTVIYPHHERKTALSIPFLENKGDKSKLNQQEVEINSNFNKVFSVWSNNHIEAKNILNEKFTAFLLKKSAEFSVYISFRNNKIYVGIDAFQPFNLKINEQITKKSAEDFFADFNKIKALFFELYDVLYK